MSTKIYNGYRINLKNPTLLNLDKLLKPFRLKAQQVAKELFSKREAALVAEVLDCLALGDKPFDTTVPWKNEYSPGFWASRVTTERYHEIYKTQHRDPDYDFECEVTVFPISDCVLAILNVEQKEFLKIFEKLHGVKHYGYWNNSDKPKNISQVEWKKRSADWDKAFSDSHMDAGFSFKSVGLYGPALGGRKEVLKHLPSFEERVKKAARDRALNARAKELHDANPKDKGFGYIFDAERWVREDPAGHEAVKAQAELCRSVFKKRIKESDVWY